MRDEIITELFTHQDLDYAAFHKRTCPNTGEMIGVRVPSQRKIAQNICKQNFRRFLSECKNEFYEETFIEGIVIARAKMPLTERLGYIRTFVPKITNWAVCDCFCNSFKFKSDELSEVWQFLQDFRNDNTEFGVRFFLIMAMTHFLQEDYLLEILQSVQDITVDFYYINMAKAWLLAETFVKFREPTLEVLQKQTLPKFVQNKAIQKIRESYRVSQADKDFLLGLKV